MTCSDCWKCCIINLQNDSKRSGFSCLNCWRNSCMQACKWIPVVFLWSIVAWSYFAYVFIVCIEKVVHTEQRVVYLIFYHIFTLMWLWTYMRTLFVNTNSVPVKYYLSEEYVDKLKHQTSRTERHEILDKAAVDYDFNTITKEGDVRYCDTCRCLKPDRCHHCSLCQSCVLKMDHHCPWVNNCVGYFNYKFFVLMLFYSCLMCIFISATTLPFTMKMYKGIIEDSTQVSKPFISINILALQFVSLGFLIATGSLFIYHMCLVRKNKTTLETIYAPKFKDQLHTGGFDWGAAANFKEVFGQEVRTWLLPIYSGIGDGISYPLTTVTRKSSTYDTMGKTEQGDSNKDIENG